MSAIAELNEHLARYSKKLEEVWNEASFVARGFNLGIGTTPANHPCHMEFYEELGAWVNNFMDSSLFNLPLSPLIVESTPKRAYHGSAPSLTS